MTLVDGAAADGLVSADELTAIGELALAYCGAGDMAAVGMAVIDLGSRSWAMVIGVVIVSVGT